MTNPIGNQDDYRGELHVSLGSGITDFKAYAHNGDEYDASVYWWVWGAVCKMPEMKIGETAGSTVQIAIRISGLLDDDIYDSFPADGGHVNLGIRIICGQQDAMVTLIDEVAGVIESNSGKVEKIKYGKFEAKSWDRYRSPK